MTIFSRIIAGEIPCHRVYEDAHVLAFLDIGPLSDGHLLVIPKEAKAHLDQLSDESAAAIGRVLPRLARAASSEPAFHPTPRPADPSLGMMWKCTCITAWCAAAPLFCRML